MGDADIATIDARINDLSERARALRRSQPESVYGYQRLTAILAMIANDLDELFAEKRRILNLEAWPNDDMLWSRLTPDEWDERLREIHREARAERVRREWRAEREPAAQPQRSYLGARLLARD